MNNLQLTRYTHLGLSIILGFLLSLIAISTIHAQKPGDLDPTFGNSGIVTTTLGSPWEWGLGVAVQPDDKIVVVGERMGYNGLNFIVLRYTVTGTLDSTFNDTGFITTSIADRDSAYSVVIQPNDGKIVAAGYSGIWIDDGEPPPSPPFDYAFAVARYTVTGTLDTTFNDTGIVTTPISTMDAPDGHADQAVSVALQPQGEIVLAGNAGYFQQDGTRECDIAVVRYTPTGTLDSTFNHTGIVTTPIGNGDDEGGAVAVQSDGNIVVAGHSENSAGDGDFALVRYTPTGTLDSTFGPNHTGIVTTSISSEDDWPYAIAIQSDGKIVVSGFSDGMGGNFAVVRYTITGTLDSAFNHTGIVTTSMSTSQEGYKMALQPDGKILVAGYSENDAGNPDFTVIRYTSSGTLDTTFNQTGVVTTPIGSSRYDMAVDVGLLSDGKIVVAGIDGEDSGQNFVVARYLNHWHTTIFVPVILKE